MLKYPNIDPTIFNLGPLQVRWYGLMYILGFAASYFLVKYQIRKKRIDLGIELNDIFLYIMLGLIIGARLGYTVFYNFPYYLDYPLKIFAIWEGGMSFHGGLIGAIFFGFIYLRLHKADFWSFADLIIVTAPIGLGLGRLGNFLNGELYGRVTNVPWAMVFPQGGGLPRHPSQIYEIILEGILLFLILWWLKDYKLKKGTLFCLFFILYSAFRFFIEFFRAPDPQLGLVFLTMTMGQILSIFMASFGVLLLFFRPSNEVKS